MKQYYVRVLFLICLIEIINAFPTEKPPNYTNHKNYRLLPSKDICGNSRLTDKIFGGEETELGEYPWVVRLKYKSISGGDLFACAGSLINERYIVTAAHCIVGQPEIIQVRLGEHDERTNPDTVRIDVNQVETADPVVDVDVEEIIPYQGYNSASKQDDIALIRLKQNITFTDWIAPVCLPLNGETSDFSKQITIFKVVGWGLTEKNVTSPIKLKTKLPFVSFNRCSAIFRHTSRNITAKHICAGGKEGVDSCRGDSGGPLLFDSLLQDSDKNYLAGIVSFGTKECGKKGAPGVYTRVSSYIDWILDNMKPF